MHQKDEDHLIPGPGLTVALHSAVLLTHGLDPDQDPGLTLFPPVGPALVHVPMAALIPVPIIPDAMDAVMDALAQGPALVRGLMGSGAQGRHGPLPPTGEEAGREQRLQHHTGHGLVRQVATEAAARVDESPRHGIWYRMS